MALYLGNNRVSATSKIIIENNSNSGGEISSSDVVLTESEWDDLKDAVEYRTGYEAVSSADIDDLVDQLNESYQIEMDTKIQCCNGDAATWTRPQGWPDLDSLNLQFDGNTDFIYMTYRTGHDDDFLAFHIELVGNTGTANVDFGHISNGSYVPDSTRTVSHNTNNYYYFNTENEGYIVVKITGSIKIFRLIGAAAANGTPDSRGFVARQQHMLEKIAYVPNITNFYASGQFWGTYDLEREKIGNGTGNACTKIEYMYNSCYKLLNLDISQFYTPNVTTFANAFDGCYSLKSLSINHFNTEKVTTFSFTFGNCYSLQSLNLSNWQPTNKLINTASMFQQCRSLISITGLENFDMSKVTSTANMFYDCRNLLNLDAISNWDTSSLTTPNGMFYDCYKIRKLNLKNWNVSKITTTSSMFYYCYSLKEILFPSGPTSNITSISCMFYYCTALQKIDVSWLKMDAGTCTIIGRAFYYCYCITELNFPNNWDLSGVNNSNYSLTSIFYNCHSLQKITGITNWDLRGVTSQPGDNIFAECWSLKTLDISGWKINATNYANMFIRCFSLENINISGFDFSNCTSVGNMFQDCQSLKSITYPSTWNTSKLTSTASMFQGCFSLPAINIDFSTWDFSKVTTIASMFAYCHSLRTLSINNWNLPLCTTIATIFNYCHSIEEISWSGWSIPKVTTTSPGRLLADCWSLKKMTGFPPIKLAFNMQNTNSLPKDEFVTLFNNLENTGGTARTLNLSTQNLNRLSAAEKAIATNKGWTLAN